MIEWWWALISALSGVFVGVIVGTGYTGLLRETYRRLCPPPCDHTWVEGCKCGFCVKEYVRLGKEDTFKHCAMCGKTIRTHWCPVWKRFEYYDHNCDTGESDRVL